MVRKHLLRISGLAMLTLLLAVVLVALPTKAAHAQTANANVAQDTCGGFDAPAAAPPVTCYSDSVTVTTWGIAFPACNALDWDPLGYIMYYTTYSGWSYYDSNGAGYNSWWQSWEGSSGWQTVSGPAIVLYESTSWECGIPY